MSVSNLWILAVGNEISFIKTINTPNAETQLIFHIRFSFKKQLKVFNNRGKFNCGP